MSETRAIDQPSASPTSETARIESLDVFRGFALLGILLLNVIGFGLLSPSYSNPAFDLVGSGTASIATWGSIELLAEGAMRGLFSMLFGAGVVLFTTGANAKSAFVHYKRTFWLLMFGLFNAYVLLWNGDILVAYALAGAVLYFVRNRSVKALTTLSAILILLMSLLHAVISLGLEASFDSAERVAAARSPEQIEQLSKQDLAQAEGWLDFIKDFRLSEDEAAAEIEARTNSYATAFEWNAKKNKDMYQMILPTFLIWDALAMMLLGMALYKSGVLRGIRSPAFYFRLMLVGFAVGLTVNAYEVYRAYASNFDIFMTFAQMQPTYHIGRLGMALGYIGLVGFVCARGSLAALRHRLAAVGRMALTNYLMQSLIFALIFSGMGLGLLGEFTRFELYGFVIVVWGLQLWYSQLWLSKFQFGPVEWLWRYLTYGAAPRLSR